MRKSVALVLLCVANLAFAEGADLATRARALRLRGKHAEAQKLLAPKVDKKAETLAERYELGLVYRETGARELEKQLWNRFYDDFDAGRIDKKRARDLTYVALAARWLGGTEDANDTFREAVDADPKGADGARANIEWAALFLEKYDAGHAEVSLNEALKILPRDPDAHALMARVKLEQGYDFVAATREAKLALDVDSNHAGARLLLAEMHVDAERYAEAAMECDRVLALNPTERRARELRAAMALLRDDRAAYDAEKAKVLAVHSSASGFFTSVAEALVRGHRYEDARKLQDEAIAKDAKDATALAALGANLLRLGEDAQGLETLQRAWKRDRYNVRTYNLLNLFEDVIPKQYTILDAGPLRFRIVPEDRGLIEKHVAPMLRRELDELSARYHFKPKSPITIELYQNPEHYAVRTVGLPGLDAIAVTFGQVITGMSPSLGKFNWGMAMWHELAHVYAIQMTGGRVPRWFTEGLSEYETARQNTDWRRHTFAELARAERDGQLLSVVDLNRAFIESRSVSQMVVAYHQAAEVVTFLVKRWEFSSVVRALALFREGKDSRATIEAVTGLSAAAFDAAFRADLSARLSPYRKQFFIAASEYAEVDRCKDRVDKSPKDPRLKALYALALAQSGDREGAQKQIDEALGIAPTNKEALLGLAYFSIAKKAEDEGKAALVRLIEAGGDGYDARLALLRLAVRQKNVADAKTHAASAEKFDPELADPALTLGKFLLDKDEPTALAALERAARLDVMSSEALKLLVERYQKLGDSKKLAEAQARLRFIAPR